MFAFLEHWKSFIVFLTLFAITQKTCYNCFEPRYAKLIWQFPCHIACSAFGLLHAKYNADMSMALPNQNTNTSYAYCFFYAYWFVVIYDFVKYYKLKDVDFKMMILHHLVTVIALLSSDFLGYRDIGLHVLLLHDISDVFVMLLKLCAKFNRHVYIINTAYAICMIVWIYTRLYLFTYKLNYLLILPIITRHNLIPAFALFVLSACHIVWTKLLICISLKTSSYEQHH